ncbi:hypothetical protein [Veillonella magna]|uniref:Uncharacterized protein n=1 Tax=Veillonella magna TaxID=464322 RepID=A0ABS2GEU8_9FIRM|nr:hypothetical protein [Veillonella magna]MBM6823546.1 hypothetical protein [Veillonella magna]MBM6911890.1 hypothetical protein [Veillonella magna]
MNDTNDTMYGIKRLMSDLGVSNFRELADYIDNPLHADEPLVIELNELLEAGDRL